MTTSGLDTMLIREGDHTRQSGATRSLPQAMLEASVKRVGIIAPLYAFTYFAVGLFPAAFVDPAIRDRFYGEVDHWLPGVLSIVIALLVMILMRSRVSLVAKLRIGILFEIVGSYGIAFAEYHDITSPVIYANIGVGGFGLSWVAVWVMLFTIAVPAPPRTALAAAALSVSAVPVVYGLNYALGQNFVMLNGVEFFFTLVFPYLLVVLMAYSGARIVYRMGCAVREAQEMGSYRLVERLGKGGMGEVWRAEHRTLAKPAAIKLIRPEVLGGGGAESEDVLKRRFEREAHATALLRSPHTIEVYDFGVTDAGTFYYVMELLDGFDLDQLVEQFGPLPPERAIHLLRDLADSLAEAHEAGLIHRDVKPANVYACRQGQDLDFVKVLDFGLVKPTTAPKEDVKLTAEQSTGGTPAFMSPEQAVGDDIDARSDIYSVGCVGYWLLTASNVFEGRSPVGIMMQHVQQEPEPPSKRTEIPIPSELDAVIMWCLAKDRADRPQTADELRVALEAIPLAEAWTRQRARKWWDAHHVSTVPRASVGHVEAVAV